MRDSKEVANEIISAAMAESSSGNWSEDYQTAEVNVDEVTRELNKRDEVLDVYVNVDEGEVEFDIIIGLAYCESYGVFGDVF